MVDNVKPLVAVQKRSKGRFSQTVFQKRKKKDDVNSRISKEILFNFSFSRNQRPAKKRWSTAENDKKEEEKYCHKQTVTLSIYKQTEPDTIQGVLVTECRYEKYCNLKQS